MPLIPACETLRSKDYKSEVSLSCTQSPYVKKNQRRLSWKRRQIPQTQGPQVSRSWVETVLGSKRNQKAEAEEARLQSLYLDYLPYSTRFLLLLHIMPTVTLPGRCPWLPMCRQGAERWYKDLKLPGRDWLSLRVK